MPDSPYKYPDTSQVAQSDQIRSAAANTVPKPGYYDPQSQSSGQDADAAAKQVPKPGYYDPEKESSSK